MPFITFEGVDGSGKSLQAELLKSFLEKKGKEVLLTREPFGMFFSKEAVKAIADGELNPVAELFLFLADRAGHVEKVIKPFLRKGGWVISDRFYHSTLAYQGFGLGMDINLVKSLCRMSSCGIEPDITFLLDIPLKEARKRLRMRGGLSGMEKRDVSFFDRVRRGYLEMYKWWFERMVLVDGRGDPEEIHKKIVEVLTKRFHGLL